MAASGFHLVRQIRGQMLQCWDKVTATLVKPSAVLIIIIEGLRQRKARNAGGVPIRL